MRNRILSISAACLASVLLAGATHAQQRGGGQSGPPTTSPGVGQTDRLHTQDRIHAPDQDRIRDADQDRDRLRDLDQDRDRLYLGARDRLRVHDQDGNGKMTMSEFQNWRQAAFGTIDSDSSGGFSLQEYHAARLGPGPVSGSANRKAEKLERATLRKTERFRVMDGDGDGVVTRTEFMKFGELNYLEADANDDGQLTFKELNAYQRGM